MGLPCSSATQPTIEGSFEAEHPMLPLGVGRLPFAADVPTRRRRRRCFWAANISITETYELGPLEKWQRCVAGSRLHARSVARPMFRRVAGSPRLLPCMMLSIVVTLWCRFRILPLRMVLHCVIVAAATYVCVVMNSVHGVASRPVGVHFEYGMFTSTWSEYAGAHSRRARVPVASLLHVSPQYYVSRYCAAALCRLCRAVSDCR
jgi:hypothetical protein